MISFSPTCLASIILALGCLVAPKGAAAAESLCALPTTIFCDDFEGPSLTQWEHSYDDTLHRLTSNAAHVFSGKQALQTLMSVGRDGGHLTRWFMPGYDHVFVRLYVKFEPGWECSQNCQKIIALYGNRLDDKWSGFGKAGIRPTGTDFFFASLVTLNWHRKPDPGEIIFYSYFPEMAQAGDGPFWGNFFYQNDPREAVQPGRWYCLELEVQANRPGHHDGFQRMWIDGAFKGEVLNMRWRDTDDLTINAAQLTFSGSVRSDKYEWIDNVVISRARIGCLDQAAQTESPAAARPAN